jgi:hypothetical protein
MNIFGTIRNPLASSYGDVAGAKGLPLFLSNILRFVFLAAGIYALINIVIAGYQYMTAGGDSKALTAAWGRIWQTLMGLVIIVASFVISALIGQILFGRWDFILAPVIYGP